MAKIIIKGLTKTYTLEQQKIKALSDINLEIEAGSFVTVVGRSGSGKSTLLRILCGLEEKTLGEIYFTNTNKPHQGKISMVFQEPRLMPWLTVEENMAFSLKGWEKGEAMAVVEKHLRLLGLEKFRRAYPSQISGGMAQRVALGRTLCFDPDVILMDEPLSALDAFTRRILQKEIINIFIKKQKTVIFVTHDVDEAVLLGQKVVVLEEGKIISQVPIDMPYPRDTLSKQFFEYRENILKKIMEN